MNIIEAISLGIIQGATEFLPVSSSGHLFLAEKWLGLTENLNLEILLHFGSLIAIIIYYWSEIKELVTSAFSPAKREEREGVSINFLKKIKNFSILLLISPSRGEKQKKSREFIGKLLLATVLTIPGGLLLRKVWNPELTFSLVGITLIATALIILIAEKFRGKAKTEFTWEIAALLGIVQSIAVLPGISRSGITIAFLILLGLNRKNSAKISFFLAIPTILGAMVLALKDGGSEVLISVENFAGFTVAIIASLLSIKVMTKLVEKNWIWFAPYCGILGLVLLFI